MKGLKRFIRLSREEQVLLLQAAVVVGTIRVGLWILPFVAVQRLALRAAEKSRATHPVARLVWAVTAVSRHMPGSTCLTQALAAQVLLGRSGHRSQVQIGVAKDEQHGFEAHAWLVFADQVILGGDIDRYTSILAVEAKQ